MHVDPNNTWMGNEMYMTRHTLYLHRHRPPRRRLLHPIVERYQNIGDACGSASSNDPLDAALIDSSCQTTASIWELAQVLPPSRGLP